MDPAGTARTRVGDGLGRIAQEDRGWGASSAEFVPVSAGRYSFHCTRSMHELFGMSGDAEID